jgi:hypothetical protein
MIAGRLPHFEEGGLSSFRLDFQMEWASETGNFA